MEDDVTNLLLFRYLVPKCPALPLRAGLCPSTLSTNSSLADYFNIHHQTDFTYSTVDNKLSML